MTMTAPAAGTSTPVPSGWMAGIGNQVRRETASWWTTGRWWRQAAVWSVLLAALFVLMHWALPAILPEEAGMPESSIGQTAQQFTELAAMVAAIGVVLLTQGLILDERRNGVLEWLLSKPLARPALIAAKFLGHGAGLVVAVVVAPWIVLYPLLSLAAGQLWTVGHTLATVGMLALLIVFHLALVLAISTLSTSRVAVLALPLVMIVGADLVATAVPQAFYVLPWSLGRIAGAQLAEGVLATGWPILATAGWTVALLAVAMWRLDRTEF